MSKPHNSILILEPDSEKRELYEAQLQHELGWDLEFADTIASAEEKLGPDQWKTIILRLDSRDRAALDFCRRIKQEHKGLTIVAASDKLPDEAMDPNVSDLQFGMLFQPVIMRFFSRSLKICGSQNISYRFSLFYVDAAEVERALSTLEDLLSDKDLIENCLVKLCSVDIHPWFAEMNNIQVTPTTVREHPKPEVRIIGDLHRISQIQRMQLDRFLLSEMVS